MENDNTEYLAHLSPSNLADSVTKVKIKLFLKDRKFIRFIKQQKGRSVSFLQKKIKK